MVAAVELYFDRPAERRIRVLWDALEAAGIPSMRGLLDGRHLPHLSLAVAEALDPDAVRAALDGFAIARRWPVHRRVRGPGAAARRGWRCRRCTRRGVFAPL